MYFLNYFFNTLFLGKEISVSESGSPFYSILLTVALFLCSYVVSIYFLPENKVLKTWEFCRLGLLSSGAFVTAPDLQPFEVHTEKTIFPFPFTVNGI